MDQSMIELFERIDRTVGETICIPLDLAKRWKATTRALLSEVDYWDQQSAARTITGSDATTINAKYAPDQGAPGGEATT